MLWINCCTAYVHISLKARDICCEGSATGPTGYHAAATVTQARVRQLGGEHNEQTVAQRSHLGGGRSPAVPVADRGPAQFW